MNWEAQKEDWEHKTLIPKMEVSSTDPGVQYPPKAVSLSLHISTTVAKSQVSPIANKVMDLPWKITSLGGYTRDQHEACSCTGTQRAIDECDKDHVAGRISRCRDQFDRPFERFIQAEVGLGDYNKCLSMSPTVSNSAQTRGPTEPPQRPSYQKAAPSCFRELYAIDVDYQNRSLWIRTRAKGLKPYRSRLYHPRRALSSRHRPYLGSRIWNLETFDVFLSDTRSRLCM